MCGIVSHVACGFGLFSRVISVAKGALTVNWHPASPAGRAADLPYELGTPSARLGPRRSPARRVEQRNRAASRQGVGTHRSPDSAEWVPAPGSSVPGVDRTEIRTGRRASFRRRGRSPARRRSQRRSALVGPLLRDGRSLGGLTNRSRVGTNCEQIRCFVGAALTAGHTWDGSFTC